MDPFLDDAGFVSAGVATESSHKQASAGGDDAALQFSFFGDLSAVDDSALGGALEDGLEAPPEEERVFAEANGSGDLSYATMFGNILSGGAGEGDVVDVKHAARPGTVVDPLAELMAEELERERQEEEERKKEEEERMKATAFSGGSIGLGGLLMPTTEEATSTGVGFGGSRGVLDMPFPSPPPASMTPTGSRGVVGGHGYGQQGGVMTARDLEARMMMGGPIMHGVQHGMPMTPDMIMRQQQQSPMAGGQGMSYPLNMPIGGPGRPMMPGRNVHGPPVPHSGMLMQPQAMQPQAMQPQAMPHPQSGVQLQPPMSMQRPDVQGGSLPAQHAVPGANLAQRLRALDLADKVQPQLTPQLQFTKKFSGRCMFKDEIDSILWYQSKALRQNPPYLEDYYYQAFLDKHYNQLNKDTFAPESVRELAPTEKMAAESVAFVKLEGLGRVAFSNIRRPRPLMELSATSASEGDAINSKEKAAGEDGGVTMKGGHRRLEQEPALAARVMIEDCMALILDVQDVDRIFVASGGKNIANEEALKQRRVLLVEGLASSLRLSENPERADSESDGLFLRLLARNKGRVLATRCLEIIRPPKEMKGVKPNYRVMWALLRQLGSIFKTTTNVKKLDKESITSLSRLAEGLMGAIDAIRSPHALNDAMSALSVGSQGVSFFAPGENAMDKNRKPWMCDVIAALLARGTDFSLHDTVSKSPDDKHSNGWSVGMTRLYDDLEAFLKAEGLDPKSIPVPLIGQHVINHLSEGRKETIQERLMELGV